MKRLKKDLDIPVFHDDQNGTATVVLGTRFGELRALQWAAINLEACKMSITKTAYTDKEGKVQIRDLTKGKKDRTIRMICSPKGRQIKK